MSMCITLTALSNDIIRLIMTFISIYVLERANSDYVVCIR